MSDIKLTSQLNSETIDRVIEMAWEDRTPFDAIHAQFGLTEKDVINLMRREMKLSSFKMWRARVQGRQTKHTKLLSKTITRFKSNLQRQITLNKISKRRG
ncbi:TIGR03643 family protein [Mucilaginibacter robiniae]|uniref:TIGR03643 family protein n=1 Tax=Mucilaginibacter robiniae TaxID=2728022 RepID=A0A7L5DX93_9SPHI|nr:TIGR03643 family protein [Mucilaginibacter robiniae]QJD94619.1 TIGR03643 family protein [Mucilaginibacter robiniae]